MEIQELNHIDERVIALARDASVEGFRSLDVLISEFSSGSNRFNKSGECLLGAFDAGQLVAMGGLNAEVYEAGSRAGRIRRFFVRQSWRRNRVGAAVLQEIEARAKGHFPALQLFTPSEAAAAFYEAQGYTRSDRYKVSHEKVLLDQPGEEGRNQEQALAADDGRAR